MANAAIQHIQQHVVWADGAALDVHRSKWTSGAGGTPGADGERIVADWRIRLCGGCVGGYASKQGYCGKSHPRDKKLTAVQNSRALLPISIFAYIMHTTCPFLLFGFARRSPQAEPMTFSDFIADDPESCLLA
jgi:hypothetical protein